MPSVPRSAPIVRRHLALPVPAEEAWTALTDPDEVAAWFGSSVDWDLQPGGRARFGGEDGPARRGRVIEVLPGRRLRFAWWPEEGDEGDASEVSYDLEPDPDGEGSRLTVTEQPVPAPPREAEASTARWDAWDGRMLSLWACAAPALCRS